MTCPEEAGGRRCSIGVMPSAAEAVGVGYREVVVQAAFDVARWWRGDVRQYIGSLCTAGGGSAAGRLSQACDRIPAAAAVFPWESCFVAVLTPLDGLPS